MSDPNKSESNTVQNNKDQEDTTLDEDCVQKPRHTSQVYRYAVLMETSGEECESWYYCIRYEGNEDNLKYLQKQLETVDWFILDDLSTFDLDLDHLISENTAKELTKLELNHVSFHRKFDGVLDKIEINLRKKDKNEKKMTKVFDILSYGQIEDYIDKEDLDEEDLTDTPLSESDTEDTEDNEDIIKNSKKGLPLSLQKSNLPKFSDSKHNRKK